MTMSIRPDRNIESYVDHPVDSCVDHDGITGSLLKSQRRLLIRDEVMSLLQLSGTQVKSLIDTGQLTAIRITGEERFDSRQIERLIEAYLITACRRVK